MGVPGYMSVEPTPPPGLDAAVWSGLKSLFAAVNESLQQLHSEVSGIKANSVSKQEMAQHLERIKKNLDTLHKSTESQATRAEVLENTVKQDLTARIENLERLIQEAHIGKWQRFQDSKDLPAGVCVCAQNVR